MKLLAAYEAEKAPKGKRSAKQTVWGNTNVYVGGKFWRTVGETWGVGVAEEAQAFIDGELNW